MTAIGRINLHTQCTEKLSKLLNKGPGIMVQTVMYERISKFIYLADLNFRGLNDLALRSLPVTELVDQTFYC